MMVKRKSSNTTGDSTKSARKSSSNGKSAKGNGATKTASASKSGITKTSSAKSTPSKAAASKKTRKLNVSPEQRMHMIQEAAYFKSIGNGASDPMTNWLVAEREIDSQVKLNP